ncbi:ABC transporter permease subunit [bacterium]|jgi:ABC-2 type transport system permease protein|nr:ABC transporter permease subunit [bacterium]
MRTIVSIIKREMSGYFGSPVAYVFIVIFLILCGFFTFQFGDFYNSNDASLRAFFVWHPWLYLFLIPAVAMRMWAEERRTRTIELLLTLPVTLPQAILGKFLAGWLFIGIALVLTFPMVITVCYLGNPDIGQIIAGYIGSFLLAGCYLAVGSFASSLTRNQVVAFIICLVICLFFVIAGWGPVTEALATTVPLSVANFIASLSFMYRFDSVQRGVIDSRDLIYYASLITFMLAATSVVLTSRKAS